MKSLNPLTLTANLALIGFLALPFVYAQRGPGAGQQARMYNPANETTVKGTVKEVKTTTGRRGWNGTHLTLKVQGSSTEVREHIEEGKVVSEAVKKGGTIVEVHLGPAPFLKERGFNIAKGDQIEVTGATAQVAGSEALIAREVRKNGKTLVLRDAQGIPKWAGGWRR